MEVHLLMDFSNWIIQVGIMFQLYAIAKAFQRR